MVDSDVTPAQTFHESTKLSYINLRTKPSLYKLYMDSPMIPLPADFPRPEAPTLEAVATVKIERPANIDLTAVAQLLFLSSGLIKKRAIPGVGEVHYRAASSAGGLYPIEVYLVCQDVPGLEAGLYHFSPSNFALHRLGQGDYRGVVSKAAGSDEALSASSAIVIFTSIFARSTWKYRARGYRYCLWDNGTMVANLLATAAAISVPAKLVTGFVDDWVNDLLGLERDKEATFCLVGLGRSTTEPVMRRNDLGPVKPRARELPDGEAVYPEVSRLHDASSLATDDEVTAWRGALSPEKSTVQGRLYRIEPLESGVRTSKPLGDVISGRTSVRRFIREPMSFHRLSSLLDYSTRGVNADFLGPDRSSLLDIYIVVNAVDGLPPGKYYYSPERRALELLKEGDFRDDAGYLCFEQALGADASVVVFFMTNLGRVLDRYGSRGYRVAQLEAGILGGKLYLCAEALNLGASGITFYDDDVADFFSPHASGKSAMFVVTLGLQHPKNRVRPYRSRRAVVLDALARGAQDQVGVTGR